MYLLFLSITFWDCCCGGFASTKAIARKTCRNFRQNIFSNFSHFESVMVNGNDHGYWIQKYLYSNLFAQLCFTAGFNSSRRISNGIARVKLNDIDWKWIRWNQEKCGSTCRFRKRTKIRMTQIQCQNSSFCETGYCILVQHQKKMWC